jgi:hypothetical protein
MAKKEQKAPATRTAARPRSLEYADRGIKTGEDFANVMSAMMSDLIRGDITPQVGNAVCKAGDNLLKIVSMQQRYGKTREGDEQKHLALTVGK